jgi:hypothetical protein
MTKKQKIQRFAIFAFICLPNLSRSFFSTVFFVAFRFFNLWKTYVRSRLLPFKTEQKHNYKVSDRKNEEFLILLKKVIKREERNLFTTRIAFANFHFFFHHQVKGKMYVM